MGKAPVPQPIISVQFSSTLQSIDCGWTLRRDAFGQQQTNSCAHGSPGTVFLFPILS